MNQTHIHLLITHLPIIGSILGGQIRHTEIQPNALVPVKNGDNNDKD